MAIRTRAQLKAFFQQFDEPTEQEFADFLDSVILKSESIPI
jgi:hypothetical protein